MVKDKGTGRWGDGEMGRQGEGAISRWDEMEKSRLLNFEFNSLSFGLYPARAGPNSRLERCGN